MCEEKKEEIWLGPMTKKPYTYRKIQKADMIFLRFKAEFRFPECPIPLNFITIRFSVKFVSVFGFVFYNAEDVSYYQNVLGTTLTEEIQRDNVKIESAKYSFFDISIRKCLDLSFKYLWSKMEVAMEEIRYCWVR